MMDSPYYPPRAGLFSPLRHWARRWYHLRAVERLALSSETTLASLAAAFLVPGLALQLRGHRILGPVALGGCGLCMVVFLAALGYPLANGAISLLLSIHAIGMVYYVRPMLGDFGRLTRAATAVGICVALLSLIYLPLLSRCQTHWFMPVRRHGHVIVVHAISKTARVKVGDWIAYRYAGSRTGPVVLNSGVNLAPVLAQAGDEVTFTATNYVVNGVSHAALEGMPAAGDLRVPENCWFAWTEFAIYGHGNVNANTIADARVQAGMVTRDSLLGAPFRWWFWRNQALP